MPAVSRWRCWIPLVALILRCVPCSGASDSGEKIFLENGYAFVDVTINGHGPFRMLIDTGAATCMLTPDAARKAGLSLDHRVILATLAGEKIVPGASNNRVQTVTGSESNVDILVDDLPQLRKLSGKAEGVLGQSFLGRSAYLIDYALKRLWLNDDAIRRADRLPITVMGTKSDGGTVVPVVLEAGGRPWPLTLDSGASHLVIACGERCPKPSIIKETARLASYVGERQAPLGTLRSVEVGGVKMPPVDAVLVDSPSLDGGDSGVLPTNWFSAVYSDGNVVRLAPAR